MTELDDFEIDPASKENEPQGPGGEPPRREPPLSKALLAAAGVVLLATLVGVALLFRRPSGQPAPPPASEPPLSTAPSAEPTVALPSLEESDSFVRDLARGLSSHPQLGAWLAPRGLVRILTVAVQNVAEGRSPAPFLPFLTPGVRFQAVDKGGRVVADPKSYAAYDDFADGMAALDAAECARVYKILAPLFAAAYAELGSPAGSFEQAVAHAIDVVRRTPVPEDEILLRRGAVFLEYADPKLEALSLAQKHLLRTGPRNARMVKAKAEEIAQAMGLASR